MTTQTTARYIETKSADETVALGRDLARGLHGGELILLRGSLGAGKSVLARGIGEGLGVTRWRGSPTFTLVNEYPTRPPLYHLDLYRLSEHEAEELGIEEYARSDSVLVVEWPDRAPHYVGSLPRRRLIEIELTLTGPSARSVVLDAEEEVSGE